MWGFSARKEWDGRAQLEMTLKKPSLEFKSSFCFCWFLKDQKSKLERTYSFRVQYSKITVWLGSTALLARDYWDRKRKKNSWQLTKKTSVVQCINSSQLQYPLCIYLPMIIAAIIHRYVSPDFLPFSCSCFNKLIHNGLKSFQDSGAF